VANSDQLQPIYAVRAAAVPVLIEAFELVPQNFRIRLARGIGWTPERYATRALVLQQLLRMQSYTQAEARMCKAICRPEP
jgi:hypothetical protein